MKTKNVLSFLIGSGKTTILSLCFIGGTHFAHAQTKSDKPPIPIPDFMYQVMYVNQDNELVDLDKTGLSIERTNKAGRYIPFAALAGSKIYFKAEGCCAKVSHSGKTTDRYIARVEPGMDPETMVELIQLEERKDCRILPMAKVTVGRAMSGHVATDMTTFALHFKKVADGVYLITTQEQLPEGEYLFKIKSEYNNATISEKMKRQNEKGYCFSVGKNG